MVTPVRRPVSASARCAWYNAQADCSGPLSLLLSEEPCLAGQQQYLEQVARFTGAADDVAFDRLGALLFQQRRHRAKGLHHFRGRRREPIQVRRNQGPALSELADEQVETLVRRQ